MGVNVDADAVVCEVTVDATPETIFGFLTDPAKIVRWMGAEAKLEPQPGGVYAVDINDKALMRGEFVEGVAEGPEDSAIVRAVVSLAHTLNLRVIAEGVEELEQHEALRAMGCPLGQGFLYAPGVSSHMAQAILTGGLSSSGAGGFVDRREDLSVG